MTTTQKCARVIRVASSPYSIRFNSGDWEVIDSDTGRVESFCERAPALAHYLAKRDLWLANQEAADALS